MSYLSPPPFEVIRHKSAIIGAPSSSPSDITYSPCPPRPRRHPQCQPRPRVVARSTTVPLRALFALLVILTIQTQLVLALHLPFSSRGAPSTTKTVLIPYTARHSVEYTSRKRTLNKAIGNDRGGRITDDGAPLVAVHVQKKGFLSSNKRAHTPSRFGLFSYSRHPRNLPPWDPLKGVEGVLVHRGSDPPTVPPLDHTRGRSATDEIEGYPESLQNEGDDDDNGGLAERDDDPTDDVEEYEDCEKREEYKDPTPVAQLGTAPETQVQAGISATPYPDGISSNSSFTGLANAAPDAAGDASSSATSSMRKYTDKVIWSGFMARLEPLAEGKMLKRHKDKSEGDANHGRHGSSYGGNEDEDSYGGGGGGGSQGGKGRGRHGGKGKNYDEDGDDQDGGSRGGHDHSGNGNGDGGWYGHQGGAASGNGRGGHGGGGNGGGPGRGWKNGKGRPSFGHEDNDGTNRDYHSSYQGDEDNNYRGNHHPSTSSAYGTTGAGHSDTDGSHGGGSQGAVDYGDWSSRPSHTAASSGSGSGSTSAWGDHPDNEDDADGPGGVHSSKGYGNGDPRLQTSDDWYASSSAKPNPDMDDEDPKYNAESTSDDNIVDGKGDGNKDWGHPYNGGGAHRLGQSAYGSAARSDCSRLMQFYRASSQSSKGWINDRGWKEEDDMECCEWYGVTCDPTSRRVTAVELRGNGLTGGLSGYLFAINNLVRVDLSQNELLSLPDHFSSLPHLTHLNLSSASITGTIPSTLLTSGSIVNLDLSHNNLSGIVDISSPALHALDLSNNQLDSIVVDVTAKELSKLVLKNNKFEGPLPDLSMMAGMTVFDGSNNNTGSIFDLSSMTSLTRFDVRSNQLTGLFPALPPSLQSLYLSSNSLSGSIPITPAPTTLRSCYVLPNSFACPTKEAMSDQTSLSSVCHLNTCTSSSASPSQVNDSGVASAPLKAADTGSGLNKGIPVSPLPGENATSSPVIIAAPSPDAYGNGSPKIGGKPVAGVGVGGIQQHGQTQAQMSSSTFSNSASTLLIRPTYTSAAGPFTLIVLMTVFVMFVGVQLLL